MSSFELYENAPTPPSTPRPSDTRPVILLDFDGTLTPHPGGHPQSLFNEFVKHFRASAPSPDESAPSYYAQSILTSDVLRRAIVEAYTTAHVSEKAAAAVRDCFIGLAARGFRLLLVSHNFAVIARPYLAALGIPEHVVDWDGSVFAASNKIDQLLATADGPLQQTPGVVYVDDDHAHIVRFYSMWDAQHGDYRKLPIIVHHLGTQWIGENGSALRFLGQLTPAKLLGIPAT